MISLFVLYIKEYYFIIKYDIIKKEYRGYIYMKKIYCFVSSTFEDMQAERDLIKKSIAPVLNKKLNKYGINLEFIDLRWGIDTKNLSIVESNRKVLTACFNEIKNSEPFFISFIGEKYGYIPEIKDIVAAFYSYGLESQLYEDKSITEMEIKFADEYYKDKTKTLYFFRDEVDYKTDENAKKRYTIENEEEDKPKLINLKNKIKKLYPDKCMSYNGKWDIDKQKVILNEELENTILSFFEENIDTSDVVLPNNIYEVEEQNFDLVVYKNNQNFAGRIDEVKHVLDFVESSKHKLLLIKGNSGVGKTFLVSRVIEELQNKNISHIKYYCGTNENTTNLNNLLKHIIYYANNKTLENISVINENNFVEIINNILMNKKLLIIIDAIDQLNNSIKLLKLLNTFFYSENIKFIISVANDYRYIKRLDSYDREELKLLDFNIHDSQLIYNLFFVNNKKEHIKKVEDYLFQKKRKFITNPLYLSLMIQKLNNLSYIDFNTIYAIQRKKKLSFSVSLEKYLIKIIKQSSNSILSELDSISKNIVKEIPNADILFDIISIVPNGISKDIVFFIYEKKNIDFYDVDYFNFIKMAHTLISENNDGSINYKHKYIRKYYLKNVIKQNKYKEYMSLLLNYFETKNDFDGQLYYSIKSESYDKLYNLIVNQNSEQVCIDNFSLYLKIKKFDECILNLFKLGDRDLLLKFFNEIVRTRKISYKKAKILMKHITKKYKNNLNSIQEIIENYILFLYNKKQYKDVIKMVSIHKKIVAPTIYYYYIELKLLSEIYLGKKNIESVKAQLFERYNRIWEAQSQELQRDKARLYLRMYDEFFEAYSITKYKSFFFDMNDFEQLISVLDLFYDEAKIEYISKYYLYMSHSILQKFLLSKAKPGSEIETNIRFKNNWANGYIKVIDDFLENKDVNIELKAEIAFNLAKYYDNSEVEYNNCYIEKATELYSLILKDNYNLYNLKKYADALYMNIQYKEMNNVNIKREIDEMLEIAKQLVYYSPSTAHYDLLEDIYKKCKNSKKENLYSIQERIDEKKYKNERRKTIKYELSEERQIKKHNTLLNALTICMFTLLLYIGYLICSPIMGNVLNNKFYGIHINNIIWKNVITYCVIGFILANSIINVIKCLYDKKQFSIIGFFKIGLSILSIIGSIVILSSEIFNFQESYFNDKILLVINGSLDMILYELLVLIISLTIKLPKISEKMIINSSEIINYKNYVLNFKEKKIALIIEDIIIFVLYISFYNSISNFINEANLLLIETDYEFLISLLPLLNIILIIMLSTLIFFDIFLFIKRYKQSKRGE